MRKERSENITLTCYIEERRCKVKQPAKCLMELGKQNGNKERFYRVFA